MPCRRKAGLTKRPISFESDLTDHHRLLNLGYGEDVLNKSESAEIDRLLTAVLP